MTINRLSFPALALFLFLYGCATPNELRKESPTQDSHSSSTSEEMPAAVKTEPIADLAVPESVRPAIAPEKPADPHEKIRLRFAQIGRDDLLVVRAQVESVSVSSRKVPETLHWGPYPHVVTTLKLHVVETYCGSATESVIASYVGGRLPDGTIEMTELTPQQMTSGMEHVFFLRSVGDEYFLELGREDMLQRNVDGHFTDASARIIELKYLQEACR